MANVEGVSGQTRPSVSLGSDADALKQEVDGLEAAYKAAVADPLNYYCHLEVAVGGEWKGVHVHNQSANDGTGLVRHAGAGNRVKFTRHPDLADAHQLAVEVQGSWKGTHVHNQSSADYAGIIRHNGAGNAFKIVKTDRGTFYLLVNAGTNYTEWKGIHVNQQRTDDNTGLIRHHGNGNEFRLVKTDEVANPAPIDAAKDQWSAKKALYDRQQEALSRSPDDLQIIEGIGPKISELLVNAGITSFKQLAATEVSRLKAVLTAGGTRYATADPSSWPEQARLAGLGLKDELAAYQASLTAGRDKTGR